MLQLFGQQTFTQSLLNTPAQSAYAQLPFNATQFQLPLEVSPFNDNRLEIEYLIHGKCTRITPGIVLKIFVCDVMKLIRMFPVMF